MTTKLLFQFRYSEVKTGYILSLWLLDFPLFGLIGSYYAGVWEVGLCLLGFEIGLKHEKKYEDD